MTTTIEALTRFPVKGLSGQPLKSVLLESGQGFPNDRRFGFARPNSGFDLDDPKPMPKTKFYMLARDSTLALLRTEFEDSTGILSITASKETHQFDITSTEGKKNASLYLKTFLSLSDDETPQLYEASPHRFTDVSVVSTEMMNAISIINLESVLALSKKIGEKVDPRRFRGNIHLANLPPFSELEAIDQPMRIGEALFKIVKRTKRCPATEVNLDTGERNLKIPTLLREHYGHMDMGVYAEVLKGGVISKGDVVELG